MKSEYIIEENIINPLYENTYRDIAFDFTKELDNPIIINRIVITINIFLLKYLQYYGFEITKELYIKCKLNKQD